MKNYYSKNVKAIVLLWIILISSSTVVSASSSITKTEGYVSGQLSRANLDRNQGSTFGKIYIGEILLGNNSATFISLGNQPPDLVTNPWRFCFEKDEYDEIENLIGHDVMLEFKTPRSSGLLSCTSVNELVAIRPINDEQTLEETHLVGAIRTSGPEISHGVEFGRIINVIKDRSSFNLYFMTIQIGTSGSKFRHFIMEDTDLFDFAIESMQASAVVKVHYSERFSRLKLLEVVSLSYVSEIEIVDQDNTD